MTGPRCIVTNVLNDKLEALWIWDSGLNWRHGRDIERLEAIDGSCKDKEKEF